MKIVLALNVLNEEKNIARILHSYNDLVDETIVVDGGSTDYTMDIALSFSRVDVKVYPALSEVRDGIFLNNITRHVEYICKWAEEIDADWIIYDDCDCVPNYLVKENCRNILETSTFDTVFIPRVYIYGKDKHFPNMVMRDGKYTPSLWAWRTSFDMKFDESIRHLSINNLPDENNRLNLYPPYCLLHYFAPDEETIQKKMDMQRKLVGHEVQHPLQLGGELEDLPEWARR
jgi:glycosyltransferase involved in cell wall biosynthesis